MWGLFSRDPIANFGYEVLDRRQRLGSDFSTWQLHVCRKKDASSLDDYSAFTFDATQYDAATFTLAKTAFKLARSLRHPSFLSYVDGIETEAKLLLIVPYVSTLRETVEQQSEKPDMISWGLLQVARGIQFLNGDAQLVHSNIHSWSVFVTKAGDWKLFGLDYCVSHSDSFVARRPTALLRYCPPECDAPGFVGGPITPRSDKSWSPIDSWGLGCLIWEVYNGQLQSKADLPNTSKIHPKLIDYFIKLCASRPERRMSAGKLLESCRAKNAFMDNSFCQTMQFLEEIDLKEAHEKMRFYEKLHRSLDDFPTNATKFKILPLLLHAFQFSEAGCAVLPSLLKIGETLTTDDFQSRVLPCIVQLFSQPDRATRIKLLESLPEYAAYLTTDVASNKLWPHVLLGFSDSNPLMREATVKSMVHFVPKFNTKLRNDDTLKHIIRLQQNDAEPGIRTNATVCLGKLAPYLQSSTRQKVLLPALGRPLRDPFPSARHAAVLALMATSRFYSTADIASRLLPGLCPLTLDSEDAVRKQTFRAIRELLEQMESVADDFEAREKRDRQAMTAAVESDTGGAGSAVSSWAGWAVSGMSSIVSKLPKSSTTPSKTQDSSNIGTTSDVGTTGESSVEPSKPLTNNGDRIVPKTPSSKEIEVTDIIEEGGWSDFDDTDFGENNSTTNNVKTSLAKTALPDDLEKEIDRLTTNRSTAVTSGGKEKISEGRSSFDVSSESTATQKKRGPLKLGAKKVAMD